MRCIVYARYSTDRQTESSIDDQLRVCREFAAARDWSIAGEFVDRGISGAAIGNRPGLQAALDQLLAGDAFIINDLTRLSRSQDLPPLLARLKFRGVRVLGAQDGFDTEARTARMQAGLSGLMSEDYRANIADRTHTALEQRARDGRSTGGKAFSDMAIVREIFRRFADGESLMAIARDLNRRGVPSPGANWKRRANPRGKWLVSALHALVQNERYIGRLIWNRSTWVKDPDTGRRRRRERPRSEWIIRECEALVDMPTWERAQARFRPGVAREGVMHYVLSGLLVCGLCNARLIIVGGSQRRYVCGTRRAAGPEACANKLTVPRVTAERYILEPIQRDLLSPAAIAEGTRQMRAARAAAETPAANVSDDVVTLERLVAEGTLSAEVAAPALAEARRRALNRRVVQIEGLPWPSASAWREAVETMAEVLRGDDVGAARSVLRELVGEIRCVPEGDYLVAELAAQRVLLRTGTGAGIYCGSGGPLLIYIPTRAVLNRK